MRRSTTIIGMTLGAKFRWGFTFLFLFFGLTRLIDGAWAEGIPMTVLGLAVLFLPWLWRWVRPPE